MNTLTRLSKKPVAVHGVHLFNERASYHWYHLVKLKIFGDVASSQVLELYKTQFVPAEHVVFSTEESTQGLHPRWAFRPSHAVPTYALPAVDDTDGDGVPEVYVGSYSRELSVLDGRDGSQLWDWRLPFGVIGGRNVGVADVDGDGEKEVIFGSAWTLPIRVYALRTAAGLRNDQRLKWARNVSGDWIEAALNIALEEHNYIVAATRDAPYSRGSLNVMDESGRFHYPPISGVDVCVNRIAIGPLGRTARTRSCTEAITITVLRRGTESRHESSRAAHCCGAQSSQAIPGIKIIRYSTSTSTGIRKSWRMR